MLSNCQFTSTSLAVYDPKQYVFVFYDYHAEVEYHYSMCGLTDNIWNEYKNENVQYGFIYNLNDSENILEWFQ